MKDLEKKHSRFLDIERYVLIELSDNSYTPYDILNKGVIILEIDSEAEYVIDLMIKNGNKILKSSDIKF